MASEKNITMRQYNGVDYDTLYPKTKVEQVEGLLANYYSKSEILSDSTKNLYGLNINDVPDSVLSKIYYIMYGTNEVIYRWKRDKDVYNENVSSKTSAAGGFAGRGSNPYIWVAYSDSITINNNGTLSLTEPVTNIYLYYQDSSSTANVLANKYFVWNMYDRSSNSSYWTNISSCRKGDTNPTTFTDTSDGDRYVEIHYAYTITLTATHYSEIVSSTNPSAYPIDGDGWTYTSLSNIPSSPGFSKIETGSYIGTGAYGESNPNTLTFDSPPKLVLIHANSSSVAVLASAAFIYGSAFGSSLADDYISELHLIWSGNTLSWYRYGGGAITGDVWQLNASGVEYYYAAVL